MLIKQFLSFTEHLIVDPDTPSIINGGVMKLSGPCFSPNNTVITCMFYDANQDIVYSSEVINGIITINDKGNEKAICPMPFFKTLGNHSIVITVDNFTTYSGSFTVGEFNAALIYQYLCMFTHSYIYTCLHV